MSDTISYNPDSTPQYISTLSDSPDFSFAKNYKITNTQKDNPTAIKTDLATLLTNNQNLYLNLTYSNIENRKFYSLFDDKDNKYELSGSIPKGSYELIWDAKKEKFVMPDIADFDIDKDEVLRLQNKGIVFNVDLKNGEFFKFTKSPEFVLSSDDAKCIVISNGGEIKIVKENPNTPEKGEDVAAATADEVDKNAPQQVPQESKLQKKTSIPQKIKNISFQNGELKISKSDDVTNYRVEAGEFDDTYNISPIVGNTYSISELKPLYKVIVGEVNENEDESLQLSKDKFKIQSPLIVSTASGKFTIKEFGVIVTNSTDLFNKFNSDKNKSTTKETKKIRVSLDKKYVFIKDFGKPEDLRDDETSVKINKNKIELLDNNQITWELLNIMFDINLGVVTNAKKISVNDINGSTKFKIDKINYIIQTMPYISKIEKDRISIEDGFAEKGVITFNVLDISPSTIYVDRSDLSSKSILYQSTQTDNTVEFVINSKNGVYSTENTEYEKYYFKIDPLNWKNIIPTKNGDNGKSNDALSEPQIELKHNGVLINNSNFELQSKDGNISVKPILDKKYELSQLETMFEFKLDETVTEEVIGLNGCTILEPALFNNKKILIRRGVILTKNKSLIKGVSSDTSEMGETSTSTPKNPNVKAEKSSDDFDTTNTTDKNNRRAMFTGTEKGVITYNVVKDDNKPYNFIYDNVKKENVTSNDINFEVVTNPDYIFKKSDKYLIFKMFGVELDKIIQDGHVGIKLVTKTPVKLVTGTNGVRVLKGGEGELENYTSTKKADVHTVKEKKQSEFKNIGFIAGSKDLKITTPRAGNENFIIAQIGDSDIHEVKPKINSQIPKNIISRLFNVKLITDEPVKDEQEKEETPTDVLPEDYNKAEFSDTGLALSSPAKIKVKDNVILSVEEMGELTTKNEDLYNQFVKTNEPTVKKKVSSTKKLDVIKIEPNGNIVIKESKNPFFEIYTDETGNITISVKKDKILNAKNTEIDLIRKMFNLRFIMPDGALFNNTLSKFEVTNYDANKFEVVPAKPQKIAHKINGKEVDQYTWQLKPEISTTKNIRIPSVGKMGKITTADIKIQNKIYPR